jgi:hypothetical protein
MHCSSRMRRPNAPDYPVYRLHRIVHIPLPPNRRSTRLRSQKVETNPSFLCPRCATLRAAEGQLQASLFFPYAIANCCRQKNKKADEALLEAQQAPTGSSQSLPNPQSDVLSTTQLGINDSAFPLQEYGDQGMLAQGDYNFEQRY